MKAKIIIDVEEFYKIPRSTMGKFGGVLKVTAPDADGRSQKFIFVYTGVISIIYKDYGREKNTGICHIPHVLKALLDKVVQNSVENFIKKER